MSTFNAVQLRYNGVVFANSVKTDQLTAKTPCPLVSINTETNRDINNEVLYDRNVINLEGIILSSGKTDFLTQAYTGVVSFFKDPKKQNSLFEIVCGSLVNNTFTPATNGFIEFSGTSFVSSNADKSNDNWYLTIPYTVVLESISKKDSNILIESYDDSWTVEPLEDVSYYSLKQGVDTYDISASVSYLPPGQQTAAPDQLRHNTPPSAQLVVPSTTPTVSSVENHLQYRITHRVSAVGKPIKIFNPANPNAGGNASTTNNTVTAYENAAMWTNERVNNSIKMIASNSEMTTYSSPIAKPTGVLLGAKKEVIFNPKATGPATMGLFLYNHIRSIESSPSAGSYGITDTWLALGTGVKYTEDFTWEISVDDKWVHTISMNGTIKGLETVGGSGPVVPGTQPGYTVMPSVKSGSSLDLSSLTGVLVGSEGTTNTIPFLIANKFPNQHRGSSKYENALQAYVSGVKPYLYVRANHALKTIEVPPVTDSIGLTNSPYAPYKRTWFGPATRPLNIIPVSVNETFNPSAGSISYNISYDNRPACLLSGALQASLTVNDTMSADIVAEAFILGRPLGPVIEKVGSSKSERQFTLEATYPMPTGFQSLHPQSPQCVIYHTKDDYGMEYKAVINLVDAFKPVGAKAFGTFGSVSPYSISKQGQVFTIADSETWSPFEGRYTRNVTWIYNTGTCT